MPPRSPLISVVIPTWNEARNLLKVLEGARPHASELIVVDRHSKDGTREIAERFGATVLLDDKKGKGAALRLGASRATGDIVVFLDADHSHDPNDIPRLLAPILSGEADHVCASRMLGGSDELFSSLGEMVRLAGNLVVTWTLSRRFGVRLTDAQNGYRCLRRELLTEFTLAENSMTIEMELVVETLRRGYRLVEIPSHEYRRNAGNSTLPVLRAAPHFLWSLPKLLLRRSLKPVPADLAAVQERLRPFWPETVTSTEREAAQSPARRAGRAAAPGRGRASR